MINWQFNPNEYDENSFAPIPAGDHRVRINDVVEKTFKSGSQGFEITLDVSGHGGKLWYYLVLDPTDTKKTNQRLGSFFDSFGITNYNLAQYQSWKGKIGAVRVKHEEYNGEQQAKVAFPLSRKNQDKLAPWKESGNGAAAPATGGYAGFAPTFDDSELPFN